MSVLQRGRSRSDKDQLVVYGGLPGTDDGKQIRFKRGFEVGLTMYLTISTEYKFNSSAGLRATRKVSSLFKLLNLAAAATYFQATVTKAHCFY